MPTDHARDLYLRLLKKTLLGLIYEDPSNLIPSAIGEPPTASAHNAALRLTGQDWPLKAKSMIGVARMDNLQRCAESVIADRVPGDFIETGVWRGGSCIFMRGLLAAYGVTDRTVWVADSFEGLPAPNAAQYPQDAGLHLEQYAELAVSLEEVRENFARFDLLDDQVRFLKGWFKDSLPTAPIAQLAILRLDGDLYESTMDGLTNLYAKLSPGGYVIVDDYVIPACQAAIADFRGAQGISDPIERIDWTGVFWRKAR